MEIRASYLIVGAVVLALLAGLAAFSMWLVRGDVDHNVARYEIAFSGSVSGLPEGGQVLYRGIPVGRVAEIRIDPDNVENVLVEVDIDRDYADQGGHRRDAGVPGPDRDRLRPTAGRYAGERAARSRCRAHAADSLAPLRGRAPVRVRPRAAGAGGGRWPIVWACC